jgi:hypothetical protein
MKTIAFVSWQIVDDDDISGPQRWRGNDLTYRFPLIVEAMDKLRVQAQKYACHAALTSTTRLTVERTHRGGGRLARVPACLQAGA